MASTQGTLFHYCPTEAFVSIIRNRSIWLSALSLSNDSMEGRIASATIKRLMKRDGLDKAEQERLLDGLSLTERYSGVLGLSLSEEPDILSQWRGYADDGCGVAIGFNSTYLRTLSAMKVENGEGLPGVGLDKVMYQPTEHEKLAEPLYRELRKQIENGAFQGPNSASLRLAAMTPEQVAGKKERSHKAGEAFFRHAFELVQSLVFAKSSAFKEEQEWRLVSPYTPIDPLISGTCSYRPRREWVVPYREYRIEQDTTPPISRVYLGPKHRTPIDFVKGMLKKCGFGDVEVKASKATYR